MTPFSIRRVTPLLAALLITGCASPGGGVSTATVALPSTPFTPFTPTAVAFAPTYDARTRVVTPSPVGFVAPTGGLPVPTMRPIPPTATPCPVPVGATLVSDETTRALASATARAITGSPLPPVLTVTPAPVAMCPGIVGIPTTTVSSSFASPAPPPTRAAPTAAPISAPATRPLPSPGNVVPIAPDSLRATATAFAGAIVHGTAINGLIPATATAPPGPPTAILTATRVGVPPRFAPITFVGNGKDGGAGISGITPRNPTAPAGQSTYDEADLRAFVLAHPPIGGGISIAAAPGYTVARITLTTLGAFDLAFGLPYEPAGGRSPDTLVYVVELAGQFTMSGGAPPGRTLSFPMCVVVFDARTGDVYIEGGFER